MSETGVFGRGFSLLSVDIRSLGLQGRKRRTLWSNSFLLLSVSGLATLLSFSDSLASATSGDDTLIGDDGNDVFFGLAGDDVISGGGGVNLLMGGAGDDVITLGSGTNLAKGGIGDDVIVLGKGTFLVEGDAGDQHGVSSGSDTLSFAAADSGVGVDYKVNNSLSFANFNSSGLGSGLVQGFENIVGSDYDDSFVGDSRVNELDGGAGNDSLTGGGGNDVFIASAGVDTITDFSSGDSLSFENFSHITHRGQLDAGVSSDGNLQISFDGADSGTADDVIVFSNIAVGAGDSAVAIAAEILESTGLALPPVVVEEVIEAIESAVIVEVDPVSLVASDIVGEEFIGSAENGYTVEAKAGETADLHIWFGEGDSGVGDGGSFEGDTFSGVRNLVGGSGNDGFKGGDEDNIFIGGAGGDTLIGGGGNDRLIGESGDDYLTGGSGDDFIDGGSGTNMMYGGDGDDVLIGASGDDLIGGGSIEIIYGGTGDDVYVVGGGVIIASGDELGISDRETYDSDTLSFVSGSSGVDYKIVGGFNHVNFASSGLGYGIIRGFENLIGTSYDDFLAGDSGSNVIDGGSGADVLTGGGGSDVFIASSGVDTITDFGSGDSLSFENFGHIGSASDFAIGFSDGNLKLSFAGDSASAGAENSIIFSNISASNIAEAVSVSGAIFSSMTFAGSDAGSVEDVESVEEVESVEAVEPVVVNESPLISGSGAVSIAENYAGDVLSISASDSDGDELSYRLEGADAHLFSVDSAGVISLSESFDYESSIDNGGDGVYDFKVVVSDGVSADSSQEITVSVTNVNESPKITNVGGSAVIAENSTSVVYEVSVVDVDGDSLSFALGGADAALFSVDSAGSISFIEGADFESARDSDGDGVYDISVIASDGSLSDSHAIAVSVTNVNESPTIENAIGTADVAENDSGIFFSIIVSDVDGDSVSFALGGSDASLFEIDSTGAVSFIDGADFESASDSGGDGVYDISVIASDGSLSDSHAIAVSVTNVNESPTIENTIGTADVAENDSGIFFSIIVSDVDNDSVSFTLSGADSSLFEIDSTGAVSFIDGADFESARDSDGDGVYDISVIASDGSLSSDSHAIAVSVTNVNESPVIENTIGTADVAENDSGIFFSIIVSDADSDSVSFALGGSDASLFEIDSTGAVSFIDGADFESASDSDGDGVYDISVIASDGSLSSDSHAIAVSVTNVNESPVIENTENSVDVAENDFGTFFSIVVSDVDNDSVSFTLSGADSSLFEIDSTGAVSFIEGADFESASDSDGDGVYDISVIASDGSLSSDSHVIAVSVTDVEEVVEVVTDVADVTDVVTDSVDSVDVSHIVATDLVERHVGSAGNGYTVEAKSGETSGLVVSFAADSDGVGSGGSFEGDTFTGVRNLVGGSGSDNFKGGDEDNIFIGGAGTDVLFGGGGSDRLIGGASSDILQGGDGDDFFDGGSGTNMMFGGAGNDIFIGATGADLIPDGGSIEVIYGGDGDDVYVVGGGVIIASGDDISASGRDSLDSDTLSFVSGSSGVDYKLASGFNHVNFASSGLGYGIVRGFENLIGTSYADFLSGDSGSNVIDGGSGADVLTGGGGDDVFIASVGADTITDFGSGDSLSFKNFGHIEDRGDLSVGVSDGKLSISFDGDDDAGTISDVIVFSNISALDISSAIASAEVILSSTGLASDVADVAEPDVAEPEVVEPADVDSGGIDGVVVLPEIDGLTIDVGADDGITEGSSRNDLIRGSDGNDLIFGEGGDDVIYGGLGIDDIHGGSGADFIYGGAGDDFLGGGAGADVVDGGDGVDTAFYINIGGGSASDVGVTVTLDEDGDAVGVGGDAQGDRLYGIENIIGSGSGGNILRGNSSNNSILAEGVGNKIYGGGGDDDIRGNGILDGGSGNDFIDSYTGDSTLYGGLGNDRLYGGNGDSFLYGGAGDDKLVGQRGNNSLEGGSGSDIFYASLGTDTIKDFVLGEDEFVIDVSSIYAHSPFNGEFVESYGASSDGKLEVTIDYNSLSSSDSEEVGKVIFDNISATDSTARSIYYSSVLGRDDPNSSPVISGSGAVSIAENYTGDVLSISASDSDGDDLSYRLEGADAHLFSVNSAGVISLGSALDYESPIDNGGDGVYDFKVFVSDGVSVDSSQEITVSVTDVAERDGLTLIGTPGVDVLRGSSRDDLILGYGSNDELYGGAGNDEISGGGGDDVIYGGAGNDTIGGFSGDDVIYGGAGNDTIDGFSGDDVIYGGAGNDVLDGRIGDDVIYGGAGNDLLDGRTGDDVMYGGAGADTIDGRSGSDTASYFASDGAGSSVGVTITLDEAGDAFGFGGDAAEDELFSIENLAGARGGNNVLTGNSGNNHITASGANNKLSGGDGDDVIYGSGTIYGGAGDDSMAAGNDVLARGSGDTTIYGELGDDLMYGGTSNDFLYGGAGSDKLVGSFGTNYLEGGSGSDIFYASFGTDTIKDFVLGEDEFVIDHSPIRRINASGQGEFSLSYGATSDGKLELTINYALLSEDSKVIFDDISATDSTARSIYYSSVLGEDYNSSPVISGSGAVSIAENYTGDVLSISASDSDRDDLSYRLEGADARFFSVNSVGVISLGSAFDYESPIDNGGDGVYDFKVFVSDGVSDDSSQEITVSVTDVNDSPEFSDSVVSVSVDENSTEIFYTISASDDDGGFLTYTLSGDGVSSFARDYDGGLRFIEGGADYETRSSYDLVIVASDGALETSQTLSVNVIDVNESPEFSDSAVSVSVVENSMDVFHTISASDIDGDFLTYTLSGDDVGSFSIDSAGGLRFISGADYETRSSYDLVVVVSDGDLDVSQTLSVNVIDVAESPVVPVAPVPFVPAPFAPFVPFAPSFVPGAPVSGVTLIGGSERDTLRGGSGNDRLEGRGETDRLYGFGGDDIILGGDDNDLLYGGAGNDTLRGGRSYDRLTGGAGADIIDGGDDADDRDDLRDGDMAIYDGSSAGVTIVLSGSGDATGYGGDAEGDTLFGIENLIGSDYDDYLSGTYEKNRFEGGDGDDTLIGGTGYDELIGDAGNDRLEGGGDGDVLEGGTGVDIIYGGGGNDGIVGGRGADILYGGAGSDALSYSSWWARGDSDIGVTITLDEDGNGVGVGGDAEGDKFYGFDHIVGASGGNNVLRGNSGDNHIRTGGDNNIVYGGAGNDELYGNGNFYGGSGDDILRGGWHDSVLDGGAGDDTLNGHTGDDIFMASVGNDIILDLVAIDYTPHYGGSDRLSFANFAHIVDSESADFEFSSKLVHKQYWPSTNKLLLTFDSDGASGTERASITFNNVDLADYSSAEAAFDSMVSSLIDYV